MLPNHNMELHIILQCITSWKVYERSQHIVNYTWLKSYFSWYHQRISPSCHLIIYKYMYIDGVMFDWQILSLVSLQCIFWRPIKCIGDVIIVIYIYLTCVYKKIHNILAHARLTYSWLYHVSICSCRWTTCTGCARLPRSPYTVFYNTHTHRILTQKQMYVILKSFRNYMNYLK